MDPESYYVDHHRLLWVFPLVLNASLLCLLSIRSPPLTDASQCGFLEFAKPKLISFPGSTEYVLQENYYWSQQQAKPDSTCRYAPMSALDVSFAVLTFQVTQCKFAVKSGGHVPHGGASNIDNGVTIDLKNLNQINVSADKKAASLGAGLRWYDVYTTLAKQGLTAAGGRVADIGVGGLTLGGGISFISSRHGWACDNVINYEVVTADGLIRQVKFGGNMDDLYWALRGGGNNFGIVTRFDVNTYPQGDMWAGSQTFVYDLATSVQVEKAFVDFANAMPTDTNAQIIIAYAYSQAYGLLAISSQLQYLQPVANPKILAPFTAVQGYKVADTIRIQSLQELTVEFNVSNPGGFRQSYYALAVGVSPTLLATMNAIYVEEVTAIGDIQDLVMAMVHQPTGTHTAAHFAKNGGNALGIDLSKGPLNIINIAIAWLKPSDDARVYAAAESIVKRCGEAAQDEGLANRFLYQNYAALSQDVFASYGEANLKKLRAVSKKYDPFQVYQKLQPGHFKVSAPGSVSA